MLMEQKESARSIADVSTAYLVDKKCFCKAWLTLGVVVIIVCCLVSAGPARAGTDWLQKAKLTAADGAAGDLFGSSVSISGDYAIIGVECDDDEGTNSGSAYIFRWDASGWVQQQKLTASDGTAKDNFGNSVSISGDKAIVGAYGDNDKGNNSGSAYIFTWNGAGWVQQQKLTAADGKAGDEFGKSVSISGDYVIIGTPCDNDMGNNSGSAYIFGWDGSGWVQQQKLTASDGAAKDRFGDSVSISGDKAIVGACQRLSGKAGKAYIYEWNGTGWSQMQKLTADDGKADDEFGCSVSISGDFAIVGAWLDDDRKTDSGSAYIFRWDGTGWVQQQKLTASNFDVGGLCVTVGSQFGCSVSISGDCAIVGAWLDEGRKTDSGSAYIFRRDGTGWVQQQKLIAADGNADDEFGCSVSISGNYAIIGAQCNNSRGNNSGSVYIFGATEIGELTLLVPNGGENLVAGSTYNITWDTNGVVENVFIEYSVDGGGNWKAIDTVANTGSYPWLVPGANSNQCLVRISDVDYPPTGDISDDAFRIYVCTLAYDLNHDCFVDFFDFALLASEWLQCGDPSAPDCQ